MLLNVRKGQKEKQQTMIPRSSQLHFFEPVYDLMEVENKVRTIGNEQSISAVQSCIWMLETSFKSGTPFSPNTG
jgi:hypothetical protein